ncbi:hypothetical protein [Nocardia arthritidis]|uniref:Uncharacterized protein n=1 Tax=Nocardia arthritidis TaxID=228602 RepID=A0A6G9YSM2_9NOCA|nr:hypothetical protein [Nocardia arthritidis]QIS16208.1 hypothetical protein F5544_41995 [Nocardia arthritidis]
MAIEDKPKWVWRVAFGLAAPAAVVASFDISWAALAFVILVVIGFAALAIDIAGYDQIARRLRFWDS